MVTGLYDAPRFEFEWLDPHGYVYQQVKMDMAESIVGGVSDSESDQSDHLASFIWGPPSPSPNIEELTGELVDNSLVLRSFMSSHAIRSRPSHPPFWLIKW